MKIGLLHPGEMGAAIGAALRTNGHEVRWASAGRSDDTTRRAHAAGLLDVGSTEGMVDADVILSVCPPHAAVEVARSLAGFEGSYVDANAVSPNTARSIDGIVSRLVDGGIVGPPPRSHGTTRLYLSGPEAANIADLFAGTPVEARVISDVIGHASALKMVYAAWSKGTGAMLLAIRAAARAHGVEEVLLDEWHDSIPDLAERSVRSARSAGSKGWRWVGEMEEIAATFAAAGLPDGFHLAAAEVFRRSPRRAEATVDDIVAGLGQEREAMPNQAP
jgi:3-hydroxyisobutyrate dehydrogenase-like beta-hydroxyacid dehydrogenase